MRGRRSLEGNRLVLGLAEQGRQFFRVEDAMAVSGKSANTTVKLVERLTEAGQVVRIGRGLYALAADGDETLHPLAIGRELAGGVRYYIGYGSAMEAHGMLDAPAKVVTVVLKATTDNADGADKKQMGGKDHKPSGNFEETGGSQTIRRLPHRRVLGVEYRFVRDPQGRRMIVNPKPKPPQWMVMEMEVPLYTPKGGASLPTSGQLCEKVWVSDPEWTILTGLGRPELCGGVGAIAAALDGWRQRLDLQKLVRYTNYMRNMTAARRLGYLLERLGMQTEWTRLRLGLQVRTSYGRLEPGKPWKGDLERKWRVDVND